MRTTINIDDQLILQNLLVNILYQGYLLHTIRNINTSAISAIQGFNSDNSFSISLSG